MSEIRSWLEAIGLAQYADAFDADDIDMELRSGSTEQSAISDGDLAGSIGHRAAI
jgi:hypothetical protein